MFLILAPRTKAVIKFSLSSLRYSNCTREILTDYFVYVNKAFIASQNLLSRCEKKKLRDIVKSQNRKGTGKRGHIVADTLLLMMFLGRANARDTK